MPPTRRLFVPFATAAISSIALMPCSVVMRTLSSLNVSLAAMPTFRSSMPAAIARSAPRALGMNAA